MLQQIGWKANLDKVDDLIAENARFLNNIVENTNIFMDEDEAAFAEQGKNGTQGRLANDRNGELTSILSGRNGSRTCAYPWA